MDRCYIGDGTRALAFVTQDNAIDPEYDDRYYPDRAGSRPGGARVFSDSTNGRMFVLRLPVIGGVITAYVFYMLAPSVPAAIGKALSPVMRVLENKYYLDWFNENVLAAAARAIGVGLWKGGDQGLIDGGIINGSVRAVSGLAGLARLAQSGYVYWYALVMILGLMGLMTWQLWPYLGSLIGR